MIASRQNSRARERGSPRYRQPSSAPEKITRPAPSGQEKTTGAPLSDASGRTPAVIGMETISLAGMPAGSSMRGSVSSCSVVVPGNNPV